MSDFLSRLNSVLESISIGDMDIAGKIIDELKNSPPEDPGIIRIVKQLGDLCIKFRELTGRNIDLQAELQGIKSTRDKFFSIISHDLRSPFNAILGFSDILTDEWDELTDTEKKTFLKNIRSTSHHTFNLLEGLLDWSRIQNGKMKLVPRQIDLGEIAGQAIGIISAYSAQKEVEVISEIGKENRVWADPDAVLLVLRNLIHNAIKYSPGNSSVRVSACRSGQMVIVSVLDTGMGISQANIARLFSFEEQFKTEGTEKEKGSGLGLVVCREILDRSSGKIWVESQEGKGSLFSFSLPVNPPQQRQD